MRILAAEDNVLSRLDLRAILEGAGHELCAEARDGLEAVELARTAEPDLAILDVRMPRLDGIEAARRILAERPIPIVVVTGSPNRSVARRARAAGVRGAYLAKPYTEHQVLEAVERATRRPRTALRLVEAPAPDPGAAELERVRELYRGLARGYDVETALFAPYRQRAVDLLDLRPGETVLDAGCGTGLCFAALEERIGPGGHLVGLDASPEMLALAEHRVLERGWDNVTLAVAPAGALRCEPADAVLFSFTHDLLQSPAALANVLRHARDGARVAAVGPCWAPWWAPLLNVSLGLALRRYVTRLDGLEEPWHALAGLVGELRVRPLAPGVVYFASAKVDSAAVSAAAPGS